ncbi:DUF413 domain-containing protein [Thorsellia anophelis]|uniref:Macrodomain Ori protein n=1 Tax=Thorsellia anophelis DSM 18579 TaxID=1123402 RepID=A0A1H9YVF4_9GAMM|nr:DUF413 domain-containing protein [Thorsellia anophelis]SES73105.1 hypothetical protein SAMN02583745_00374 [Thorsellia anophelis DSM 18579]
MAESFISPRRFTDNKNYPRGLARHGDYTIKEAQLLEKHGNALLELESGSRAPITEEEKQFVAVSQGNADPKTDIEKVWMKYVQKTRQPKRFHTLSGGKPQVEGADEFIDE